MATTEEYWLITLRTPVFVMLSRAPHQIHAFISVKPTNVYDFSQEVVMCPTLRIVVTSPWSKQDMRQVSMRMDMLVNRDNIAGIVPFKE